MAPRGFGRGIKRDSTGIGGSAATGAAANAAAASNLTSGESNLSRSLMLSQTLTIGSGVVRLGYFTAAKTEPITQMRIITGTTAAAATPTLCKIGVYSVAANGDLTLAASCANDTTLFAAASTAYTRSFTGTFNKVAGQRYASAVIVVTGAATPTWVGNSGGGGGLNAVISAEWGLAPRLCASLTGQTDLPASIAAGTLSDQSIVVYSAFIP